MRIRALAVAGVSLALVTACSSTVVGVASPPTTPALRSPSTPIGSELAAQSAAALEQSGALHVFVDVTDSAGVPDYSMDLHVQGGDLVGTEEEDGSTVQLVVTGGYLYMQGPAAWWTAGGLSQSDAARLDGEWVRMSDRYAGEFTQFTVPAIADSLRHPTGGSFYEHVHADRLAGEPVWQLTSTDGSAVLVAAEGTPYPVELLGSAEQADGRYEPMDVTLTEFGVAQEIAAPTDFIALDG
jgi:hypothetical protein